MSERPSDKDLAEITRLYDVATSAKQVPHADGCGCGSCDTAVDHRLAAARASMALEENDAVGRLLAEHEARSTEIARLREALRDAAGTAGQIAASERKAIDDRARLANDLDLDRAAVRRLVEALPTTGHRSLGITAPFRALQVRMATWGEAEEKPREPAPSTSDPDPRWRAALEREAKSFEPYRDPSAQRDAAILRAASKLVRTEREARLILGALGWDNPDAVERVLAPCPPAAEQGDAVLHHLDVARIRKALETSEDVTGPDAAIDWPAFWARRTRLGVAAEAIEAPVQATVEWMQGETILSSEASARKRECFVDDAVQEGGSCRAVEPPRPPFAAGQVWTDWDGKEIPIEEDREAAFDGALTARVSFGRLDLVAGDPAPVGWTYVRGTAEHGSDEGFVAAMASPAPDTLATFEALAETDRRHGLERAPEEEAAAEPPRLAPIRPGERLPVDPSDATREAIGRIAATWRQRASKATHAARDTGSVQEAGAAGAFDRAALDLCRALGVPFPGRPRTCADPACQVCSGSTEEPPEPSRPLPPEPDDEPSAYDAEVAARLARGGAGR